MKKAVEMREEGNNSGRKKHGEDTRDETKSIYKAVAETARLCRRSSAKLLSVFFPGKYDFSASGMIDEHVKD